MRIGIIGDTHGDMDSIRKAVDRAGPVDLWLHTGDHARDAQYLEQLTQVPVQTVTGNCDASHEGVPDLFLTLEGRHIMVTHGHHYRVKHGVRELSWWAKQYEADIVIYGHTHNPLIEQEEGLLILNPGSPSYPRANTGATFGMIELAGSRILPMIIKMDN